MIKSSLVVTALLFASLSIAHAETTDTSTGSKGAASVDKNLDANKSNGKADKGLTNAEKHITADHKKKDKAEGKEKSEKAEKAEKGERVEKAERTDKPEHPGH